MVLTKDTILAKLKSFKTIYQKEGFLIKGLFGSYARDEAKEGSDIDVLVEATPKFASKYGFGAIERIKNIEAELSSSFGTPVHLSDSSGMDKTAKKFIIDRAIYV